MIFIWYSFSSLKQYCLKIISEQLYWYFFHFRVLMVCQYETVGVPNLLWRHDKLSISIPQNWRELPDVYVEISCALGMLQDIPICLLIAQQSKQNVSGDAAGTYLQRSPLRSLSYKAGDATPWDALLHVVSQNVAVFAECSNCRLDK